MTLSLSYHPPRDEVLAAIEVLRRLSRVAAEHVVADAQYARDAAASEHAHASTRVAAYPSWDTMPELVGRRYDRALVNAARCERHLAINVAAYSLLDDAGYWDSASAAERARRARAARELLDALAA